MARKEQKLIFTASKNLDGTMKINMAFYPPLANSKEAFEAMPMERREMQNALANIGTFAMKAMIKAEEKKVVTPSEIDKLWIDEAASFPEKQPLKHPEFPPPETDDQIANVTEDPETEFVNKKSVGNYSD